jgi:heme a synthase
MPDPALPSLRPVITWLIAVWVAVCAMVLLGGTVRLTGSGLSMVEWHPLMGTLPPMGQQAWDATFDAYKASPQFRQVNHWMDLDAFKRIFFWEYLHRLTGRLIGVLFALPWLWFIVRRRLVGRDALRTGVAFVLGGLQGVLGWYMVSSGLVDRPEVSHYRLAAHLALALVVACYLLWLVLDLGDREDRPAARNATAARRVAWLLLALVAVQVVWGAFMAGTRAGFLFPTFPKIGGLWLPGGWTLRDIAEHPIAIHVVHRGLGTILLLAIPAWAWLSRRVADNPRRRRALMLSTGAVALQYGLGVACVVLSVPVSLGVAHQLGGVALLSALVYAIFTLRDQPKRISAPSAKTATSTMA